MILPLRQRHRRMFAVLGVLLPIVFVAGIAARKPVPSVASLPAGLETPSQNFTTTEWVRDDLFAKHTIRVRLLRERVGGGQFAVSFSAPKDFTKPDLIVYWVAGDTGSNVVVPDGARLLGAFSAGALALPVEVSNTEGALILFSLADQEIVAISKPVRFGEAKR